MQEEAVCITQVQCLDPGLTYEQPDCIARQSCDYVPVSHPKSETVTVFVKTPPDPVIEYDVRASLIRQFLLVLTITALIAVIVMLVMAAATRNRA